MVWYAPKYILDLMEHSEVTDWGRFVGVVVCWWSNNEDQHLCWFVITPLDTWDRQLNYQELLVIGYLWIVTRTKKQVVGWYDLIWLNKYGVKCSRIMMPWLHWFEFDQNWTIRRLKHVCCNPDVSPSPSSTSFDTHTHTLSLSYVCIYLRAAAPAADPGRKSL